MTAEFKPDNVFSIDYARKLADSIALINRKWTHALASPYVFPWEKDQLKEKWNQNIQDACRECIEVMNKAVAEYQRIATDATNRTIRTEGTKIP